MWELDYKESWLLKNWCFWTVVLEKTLEIPLDCKEIQPVHPKGNQSWIFIERTDAEAEIPIICLSDAKNWFIWKDSDSAKEWRQEEKGMTEDEMAGWHHWLSGHEFEQAPGVGIGHGSLAFCSLWACKESDSAEWLKWTDHLLPLQNWKTITKPGSQNIVLNVQSICKAWLSGLAINANRVGSSRVSLRVLT